MGLISPVSIVLALALLIRVGIGLHEYSGHANPPHFGDYEAQRHWMELTVNLPVRDWYKSSPGNNLSYWGIDYPPLSAYQSWLCGKVIGWLEPESMALKSSRGYETQSSKLYMRLSVLAFDLLVFIPGILAALYAIRSAEDASVPKVAEGKQHSQILWPLVACLLQPAAILIDHGHFQYNNIGLGLTAGAAAAVLWEHHLIGSVLFCLALNHKQMCLYFAPAFFAHLLGCSLQKKGISGKLWGIAKLGCIVLATFALVWLPYLNSKEEFLTVLQRLAPLQRGLFEDYVANFWCASHLVIKWKHLFSQKILLRITTSATLLTLVPSMTHQILYPSKKGFIYSLANSAFSFFLFSYQVHEKSILLPLLPITLLASEEPFLAAWMPFVATFSMYPLLKKDGLSIAYLGALLFWTACLDPTKWQLNKNKGRKFWAMGAVIISLGFATVLHILYASTLPPARFPYLFDALTVSLSALHLMLAAIYLNFRQWNFWTQ